MKSQKVKTHLMEYQLWFNSFYSIYLNFFDHCDKCKLYHSFPMVCSFHEAEAIFWFPWRYNMLPPPGSKIFHSPKSIPVPSQAFRLLHIDTNDTFLLITVLRNANMIHRKNKEYFICHFPVKQLVYFQFFTEMAGFWIAMLLKLL